MGCRAITVVVIGLFIGAGVGSAWAQGTALGPAERDNPTYANMRVGGASTDDTGRPTLCLEVRTVRWLSVEACGTGSGFLHSEPGGEMAHFRAKWYFAERQLDHFGVHFAASAGFAELQLDTDDPGFNVRKPDPDGIEAGGPEASMSAQVRHGLGKGFELIANGTAGMAWIPNAGSLLVAQREYQPFVSFELGVGW